MFDAFELASPVNLADPVNRLYPLNMGRVAWWLTLPGWDGGPRWTDLMSLYPGTLTNMTTASGFRATTRPGGWGHLLFDGSDDYVDAGTAQFSTGAFTIAFWAYPTTAALGAFFELKFAGIGVGLQKSALATNDLYIFPRGSPGAFTAGSTIATSAWNFIVLTHATTSFSSTANFATYVNGLPVSLSATSVAGNVWIENFIGRKTDNGQFAGAIDDFGVWNRALSAGEVADLYAFSRTSYPGVLNRVNASFYAVNTTFSPAWAARANTLVGAY